MRNGQRPDWEVQDPPLDTDYICLVNRADYGLADIVADEIGLPFDRISLEILYQDLYHFTNTYHKGLATDPVAHFTDPENQDLAVVKPLHKPQLRLDLPPYPI